MSELLLRLGGVRRGIGAVGGVRGLLRWMVGRDLVKAAGKLADGAGDGGRRGRRWDACGDKGHATGVEDACALLCTVRRDDEDGVDDVEGGEEGMYLFGRWLEGGGANPLALRGGCQKWGEID